MPKHSILLGRLSLTFLVLAGWHTMASGANGSSTRLLRTPDGERHPNCVRVRQQPLDRRARGRHGAAAHQLPGPDHQSAFFARRQMARVQRGVRGQHRRLRRPRRRRRAEAPDLASGRRYGEGWTPDGKSVLFASARATWAPSAAPRFWTVPAEGGVEEPLTLPRGYQGKISPDGTRIAYRMNNSWDEERRNYRGGQNRPIWIVDLKTYDLVSPPWTDSKDMDPVWVGDAVYFISDRDGVANVWSYDTKTKKLAQATKFTDFDVKSLDAGAGAVVFEQAGYIHELDPKTGKTHVVNITAAGDFPVDDAALGRRHQPHDQPGSLAHRQAGGGGGARRDLHHPRRKGRRAQSEPLQRLGGARSGVVARWQVHLVFQRQVGRIQARHRGPGWLDAAARDRPAESHALLHALVVARFEEAALYRYQPEGLGAGCRQRPGEGGRQRSVDGAVAHARIRCGVPIPSGWRIPAV